MSAVGHAVTLAMPLKTKAFEEHGFRGTGISGTPVDCVKLGLSTLLKDIEIDAVFSGINAGANVGPDILYSGTVAAATEAALMGYPALAVSYDDYKPEDVSAQAAYAVELLGKLPLAELPKQRVLNLNFPKHPMAEVKGFKLCPQTSATYKDWYDTRKDPRSNAYYWLEGLIPPEEVDPGTDRGLLTEGWITLTPLKFEFTDDEVLKELMKNF
jgi:5'-nucleotidase